MSDFCSTCMKPAVYTGFIMKKDGNLSHILDGGYCHEHMIDKLKQLVSFLEQNGRPVYNE